MISEIPTVAIEFVYIHDNTSTIQDEVLAQRLGLIPLRGNKEGLRYLKWFKKSTDDDPSQSECSDYNTITLHLNVECTLNEEAAKRGETDPTKLYNNAHGMSCYQISSSALL
jgi:DNA-directed RNA polymerase I and III subunit RPAC1